MRKIRVLVVDDSPFIRRILVDILNAESDIEVVAIGKDGSEGIALAALHRPDVMTLDVEMPNVNGLQALEAIMASTPTRVIMVSSLTSEGADASIRALEIGAVDFICKPDDGRLSSMAGVRESLLQKVRDAQHIRLVNSAVQVAPPVRSIRRTDRVVVVASSTGGPRALTTLFQNLPKGLPVPMLIVQHMPVGFIDIVAKRLDGLGTMRCMVAKSGDQLVPGVALLAPFGTHMEVARNGEVAFNNHPQLHGVRPAADYLFKSAAVAFGSRTVGIILTGMGRDGAEGALAVKRAGGIVFGESEESCAVYGMPRAARELGATDSEVTIDHMAQTIVNAISGGMARAS